MILNGKNLRQSFLFLSPAWLLIAVVIVAPILYTIYISLTNMNIYHWLDYRLIGFGNYIRALFRLDEGFLYALVRTVVWTVINLGLQFCMALGIALLLNTKRLLFRGLYKTLLMVSWAVPSYISALIWRNGMFHNQYGFLNKIIRTLGGQGVEWLNSDLMAFVSCLIVNLWLALPFMTLVMFEGLKSIDNSYYEAAEIEGGGVLTKLFYITIPLIRPVIVPALILTAFVTFKQFDIVYLMTQQVGAKTGADVNMVITYAFEKAFTTNNYGYSAALSIIIFTIILILTILNQFYMKKRSII